MIDVKFTSYRCTPSTDDITRHFFVEVVTFVEKVVSKFLILPYIIINIHYLIYN